MQKSVDSVGRCIFGIFCKVDIEVVQDLLSHDFQCCVPNDVGSQMQGGFQGICRVGCEEKWNAVDDFVGFEYPLT